MILDAGVFIALDSPAQRELVISLIRRVRLAGESLDTNEAVLAQAWRDPARQVPMANLMKSVRIHPFGDPRTIGRRCAATGTNDVVDASLAVLADGLATAVLTTDPDDLRALGAPVVEL